MQKPFSYPHGQADTDRFCRVIERRATEARGAYHAKGLQGPLQVQLNGAGQVDGMVCNGLPLVAHTAHLQLS